MFADFHTHILHAIDDGPQTVEESILLLKAVVETGCDRLVLTPHFDGKHHSLEKRTSLANHYFSDLQKEMSNQGIFVENMYLGYELRYFSGISRCDNLECFCLGESDVLLLELDRSNLTEQTAEEIVELYYSGYTVILAHLERYVKSSGYSFVHHLVKQGWAIPQVNAASLLGGTHSHTAMRLLNTFPKAVLSSDTHSLQHRPPLLKEAYDFLRKKRGEALVNRLLENADKLFLQIQNGKH